MSSGCFGCVLQSLVDTFRDGGLRGWIAVLCLFTTKMAVAVLVKGLGMMLPSLQEQFVTSTWLIGWMVAFVSAGISFSGVLATPLKERFGARTVLTVSGLVAGISMITASFLPSLYIITFILTLLTGPAIGISFVITKHLIGGCFSKSITTAYGVADLGNSSVFVAVVPLIQLFLEVYGWRGTMLLLGGLLLHLAVCGALMKPPAASRSQDGYEAAHTDEEQETGEDKVAPSNRCGCSCFTTIYSFTRDTFQLGLFSSLSFWLVVFLVIVWRLTNTAWLIYYVQYATVYKEFTLEDASQFIVAYGIGRTVVCVVIGPLVQTVKLSSYCIWLAGALLINAIYYALDPWLMSYWTIVANTFMLGNALGMSSILIDVVIKEVFGKDQMGYVMGWTGFSSGAAMILLLYIPGIDLRHDWRLYRSFQYYGWLTINDCC
ncbi:monocarboxylate transporter 12-like [Asterias amurensis]|uniref:monocarboxylate transporter 12-like n=1 Tax=Asterias amurensis TaxID=7602 RepID=UPI003AB7DD88